MSNRKTINPAKVGSNPNYSLFFQYLMYVIFGAIMSIMIAATHSAFTGLFIVYTFLMFMLSINMIADFSTILMDTRDNTIIIPRPVSEQSYLLSRIIHIASYILGFAFSYAVVPFIVISVHYNLLTAIFFFFNVIMGTFLSLFLTNTFYMSLLKFTTGERFKDIIAYFQIAITIFFFGGYQILMRFIGKTENLVIDTNHWWIYLVPPAWMSSGTETFISFTFSPYHLISIVQCFAIPLTGLWLVVKVLSPGYSNKLVELEQGESKNTKRNNVLKNQTISTFFARLFTRSQTEAIFFQFIWKIAGRDRIFKQTVYPGLGSILVILFIIFFNSKTKISELSDSNTYLVTLYLPLFYLFLIISNLKYSDYHKAAWIYKTLPIDRPGEIVSASIKAIYVKLFLTIYILANIIFLFIKGISFILDFYVGVLFLLLTCISLLSLTKLELPFSADNSQRTNNGNMLFSVLLMPLGLVLAGIHYLFHKFNVPMIIPAFILSIICWFAFKSFRAYGWEKFEKFSV